MMIMTDHMIHTDSTGLIYISPRIFDLAHPAGHRVYDI